MKIRDVLVEFAPGGGGDSDDYLRALASAWYNGTFDTGSLQKGIKSQEDVERLLNRGIVCPDGKTRKLHIDYNSDFDGVVIYSDDYYEYGDHDETDSRTGRPFGPYDYMEFKDEELDESAKWRDSKYKGQLYTQEPPDYNDTREYDRAMWDPKPKGYPGRKDPIAGGEFPQTDPLVKGFGRYGVGEPVSKGPRKGLPSRDQITSLKGSIKDAHGRHTRANLPEQGVAEGSLNEFAPDSNDGGEEDALHKYARMWWAGDEATQMQIEKVLARMGWEIGEDEGSYDNGGVFVVRAGDENGRSYQSWPAEELTEGFARRPRPMNSFKLAQIGYTPDGPLPMADYSKYPTAVIMKAITDLNQDREKNPELIKLLTKELFKRRQQQGVAEGDLNEKSTSQAQFRTMAAAAHDPKFAKKVGIKQSVAREFNKADRGQDYKDLPKKATEGATVTTTPGSIEPGGAVDNFKQQMANNTERDMAEGNRKSEPPEADYGADYQDMVKRVKKLAGLGPLKTVYDPNRRVYRNMPTAVQPRK